MGRWRNTGWWGSIILLGLLLLTACAAAHPSVPANAPKKPELIEFYSPM